MACSGISAIQRGSQPAVCQYKSVGFWGSRKARKIAIAPCLPSSTTRCWTRCHCPSMEVMLHLWLKCSSSQIAVPRTKLSPRWKKLEQLAGTHSADQAGIGVAKIEGSTSERDSREPYRLDKPSCNPRILRDAEFI